MQVVMGMAYLLGVLQFPLSSLAVGAATATMAVPPLSGFEGAEPLTMKNCPSSFLSVSSQYACDVVHWFTPFPLHMLML
jgi:hypothetical protein